MNKRAFKPKIRTQIKKWCKMARSIKAKIHKTRLGVLHVSESR
jgi:hypothetical protein